MNTRSNKITIQVESADEGGDLTLSNFIEQLNNLRGLLSEADRIVSGEARTTIFKVTSLNHSSPSAVELTGYPRLKSKDFASEVIGYVAGSLDKVVRLRVTPDNASQKFIRGIKKLVGGAGKNFSKMRISSPAIDFPVEITETINIELAHSVLRQTRSVGSVKGIMQAYNSHANSKYFNLYPPVEGVEIKCFFNRDSQEKASAAVDRNVTVTGYLTFTLGNLFPDSVEVIDIDIHPPDHQLPSLESLVGCSPQATGNQSTSEFIRNLRNEWN